MGELSENNSIQEFGASAHIAESTYEVLRLSYPVHKSTASDMYLFGLAGLTSFVGGRSLACLRRSKNATRTRTAIRICSLQNALLPLPLPYSPRNATTHVSQSIYIYVTVHHLAVIITVVAVGGKVQISGRLLGGRRPGSLPSPLLRLELFHLFP